jgi:hypothetical protein
MFRESHEPSLQEKIASFRGSYIWVSKNKSITKRKGKKTIPLKIIEVLEM